jgi:multidrug efflux system outer membrane protein
MVANIRFPESVLYSLADDLAGPLINRSAIKAEFKTANAKQLQVDALNRSISAFNELFRSNSVDYLEVLMTQRDALQSK